MKVLAITLIMLIMLSQFDEITAIHNITEALEALAPVPIENSVDDKSSKDVSFSLKNQARRLDMKKWFIEVILIFQYFLTKCAQIS